MDIAVALVAPVDAILEVFVEILEVFVEMLLALVPMDEALVAPVLAILVERTPDIS